MTPEYAHELAMLRDLVEEIDGAAKSVIGAADGHGGWKWSRLCAGCGGTGLRNAAKHLHCAGHGWTLQGAT